MQLNRPFMTVTPTLDGDVLSVLASADVAFTINQVQRVLTNASGEGIRKVLIRLSAQGVVLHDLVGRTNTYRLNAEHLAAGPIRALAGLHNTLLDRVERLLETWAEPARYAAVFGSAMTGSMTPNSDIDLFLVRDTRAGAIGGNDDQRDDIWGEQVTELNRLVTAWTGNDSRVVEYTVEDLRNAIAGGESLLNEVAHHGRTVAGARAWLRRELRAGRQGSEAGAG